MMKIESVSFEHHRSEENLGIGERSPRISWKVVGDTPNWTQTSYEVEVQRNHARSSDMQRFRFESSDSVLVPWPTTPLQSREVASVRVRATGTDSNTTEWSPYVTVEAGLFKREDWTAQMVAAERIFTTHNGLRPTYFRKSFELGQKVVGARLYITCYGLYEASINGSRVGDHAMAPGWTSYKHQLNYQTYDIGYLLQKGMNVIGVEVGEGWYCGRLGSNGGDRCIYGDRLAVLAQLEVGKHPLAPSCHPKYTMEKSTTQL
jgi:alpha-L-rhamnosidase